MDEQESFWTFLSLQADKIGEQTLTHIGLTSSSLLLAILIGLPLGIWIVNRPSWAKIVLGIAGIMQTIPSIALLGVMIPLLGIGAVPAITALFLYALLPIIRNTYTGIGGVDPAITEASRALGMTSWQILLRVQLPLAMPVILAGVRTAAVINVGVATLAAYIAAGGLGEFIFGGIALNNSHMILAGAIPAALLAIAFDMSLALLQRAQQSRLGGAGIVLFLFLIPISTTYVRQQSNIDMLAGFTPEFMGRQDGYLGLKQQYGFKIPTVVISDAIMYKAAFQEQLDIISGYSTDGRLKAFNLVTLEDDKGIFPPYQASMLVRNDVLEKYPEIEPVLEMLSGHINDSIMTELNYQVDYQKIRPAIVAKDFLERTNLYRPPQQSGTETIRIGSKIFGEQYLLINMYKMLIEGYTTLKVDTKTGLGGTKICFDALVHNEIDMYPEYTGTGLLVLLQASPSQVAQLGAQPQRVFNYVAKEFDDRFELKWLKPIGFNNAYALMMRREQASHLKIKKISDLHYN
ncbi:osmoprotectant transport system permease protein [Dyadobacter jejuensis]|uniref:Osmoprotectant transport system permease protein n=1 Tax=Dyadobacter jejuensis TaxID=1082580 RepID=A0A316ANB5_9BACT|nr:ABC transporter permease/substrate-binding protein [Dyadobacter jejuensis]PWJ58799.1 osmoprotectant transport system permease protein [Dyadobacter jejuensis]